MKESQSISIRNLRFRDFNIPAYAFLLFYIYQYLFPQYFFPFLFKLQIPKITITICIIYAILAWRREHTKNASPVVWSFIFLGLIFFLARYFVTEPLPSEYYFNENLHMVAVGLVMLYYFRDSKKINLLFVMLIVFGTFSALIAIREGGLVWGHDFLQDENQTSALMSMIIPLTIFYSAFIKEARYKYLCYFGVAIQIAEVVRSLSRGGFVALVAVGICMLMFTKRKLVFLILIGITVFGILTYAPPQFFYEIKTIEEGTKESTAHARVEYWRRAIVMFEESPLFGKGIAQFQILSHNYVLPGETINEGDFLVCHSNWFQILSELGIIGIILYSIIFISFFRSSLLITRKLRKAGEERLGLYEYSFFRHMAIGLTIGMIGFMVAGSFINILIFPFFYTYVFLMMLLKTTFIKKVNDMIPLPAQLEAAS